MCAHRVDQGTYTYTHFQCANNAEADMHIAGKIYPIPPTSHSSFDGSVRCFIVIGIVFYICTCTAQFKNVSKHQSIKASKHHGCFIVIGIDFYICMLNSINYKFQIYLQLKHIPY